MNKTEYLLACLAEECGEVAQRATKALRFGLDEVQPYQEKTNRQRIKDELIDLITVWDMLCDDQMDETMVIKYQAPSADFDAMEAKRQKIKKYMGYAKQCGTLNGC